ncbi:MAG TPA: glycosyltransferase family 2 protein [Thermoanaerobaculia bacterium]|nr:glycosyltransferase family 2 protein [Thermoanaerobaculia bacterium]
MAVEWGVAVVNYQSRDLLRECLASLRAEGPARVVVVDNASSDGSAEMVASEYPEVVLEANRENRGYGSGANQAVALCGARYVLLLNSDTRVAPGALAALGSYLDAHPRAAAAGPRLAHPDGTLQASCFPFLGTFQMSLEKTPAGRWLRRLPAARDGYLLSQGPHDRPRRVPWLLGAALALRREAFDAVGGFDPAFFMYSEEVDLCYRLQAAGWEVHFAPVTTVVHVGGASTRTQRAAMEVRRIASARLFYRRHYSRWRIAALETMIRTAMLLRLTRDRLRLSLTRDDPARRRLAEDVAIWRGALRGH